MLGFATRRTRSVAVLIALALGLVALALPVTVAAAPGSPRTLVQARVTVTYVDHATHKATGTTLKRGQRLDFTATVKPFSAAAKAHVRWEVWGTRGGRFRVLITATSDTDTVNPIHLGQAGFDVTFNQVGRYAVRAMATGTSTSSASAWSAYHFFNVR